MSNYNGTVGIDLMGYPFNKKYLPNTILYGCEYHGYKNEVHETFFYDFAVQGYDLEFSYNGKKYYVLSEPDYVAVCDSHFTKEFKVLKNGNNLHENWIIDVKRLIDIMDECDEVEPM